jgi:hypothetical protein
MISFQMKLSNLNILSLQSVYRLSKVLLFALITIVLLNATVSAQNNFNPGEELKYIIYFGPIDAGAAKINLAWTIYNNEQVLYSKMAAKSIGLPDKIYKIRETYESYFDSINILPVYAIRDVREGRYKKRNTDTYDHQKNSVLTATKGEIKTTAGTRDVISAYYFIRNYDFNSLKKGDVLTLDIFFNDELLTFRLHYMGKEKINARIGEINCIKLIPEMMETKKDTNNESVSPTPKDEMIIWLSDDLNQIPVRVRFDLFVGSIKADLIEYINLKY